MYIPCVVQFLHGRDEAFQVSEEFAAHVDGETSPRAAGQRTSGYRFEKSSPST